MAGGKAAAPATISIYTINMRIVVLTVGLAATIAACGPKARGPRDPGDLRALSVADAPYELANDSDLQWVRQQYDALRDQAPERATERARLADEYARRVRAGFAGDRRDLAHEAMLDLVSLWSAVELGREQDAAAQLAVYRSEFESIRESFARSGGDRETVAALAVLIAVEPVRANQYAGEIDEVFRYADDLSVAQFGEGAERARPIEILEGIATSFPSPYVIERLTGLYLERQKAVESHLKRNGADFEIFRAHGRGVLRTGWNIVRMYARAHRIDSVMPIIAGLSGFGDDVTLRKQVKAALSSRADVDAWIQLASAFRSDDPEAGDLVAAFAISFEATKRFPRSAAGYFAAAGDARRLSSVPLATWLYETGLELQPKNRQATEHLARLYEFHISTYGLADRPRAASRALARLEKFHARAKKLWKKPIEPDLADAYATMGRGLVSQGELDLARGYLEKSIELRPTLDALESLGTVELKVDNFSAAVKHFEKALELPVEDLTFEFNRMKVLRLAGEAHDAAGNRDVARRYYREALVRWNELSSKADFREPYLAQAIVENGKLQWRLGHKDNALELFDVAIDMDPDGATTHADVVSFLIVRNEYDRALDAYHRALGSQKIGDYFKVYMSLWVVAEARRTGRTEDPLALRFLSRRDGRLWYDDLARFASGKSGSRMLTKRASTRGRRAELLYYTAVLGDAGYDPIKVRSLLLDVLDTDMVLFFEYDMAKHWLGRGFVAEPTAP